jgi:hypothetical protein
MTKGHVLARAPNVSSPSIENLLNNFTWHCLVRIFGNKLSMSMSMSNFQTEILTFRLSALFGRDSNIIFLYWSGWLFYLLRSWNLETSWVSWLSKISRTERWRMNRTFFCRARDTRLRMSELAEEIASTTTGLGKLIYNTFSFFNRT